MLLSSATKHKVFLSFYHYDDEDYREEFEERFGHLFTNKSVESGDIDDDNSDRYIYRLIREKYISDTSVIVVLVGCNTYRRKHVDWEIYAGLSKMAGGYSGLLGILLPTYPGYKGNRYYPDTIPPRLLANVDSGYANIIRWTTKETAIQKWIEDAFKAREDKPELIKNSSRQFSYNHPE